MAVQLQTPVAVSTANGVTTVFPYPFLIRTDSDLKVVTGGLLRTLNVDYTVTGVGNPNGGNVTFTVAPIAGQQVQLYRDTSPVRLTDYQQQGDFLSPTVNADFDRPWLKLQEIAEQVGRAAVVPRGSAAPTLPTAEVGRFLRWRSDLLGLENADLAALGALGLPVSVANGGTGAATRSTAIQNLGFIDVGSEIAINAGGILDSTSLGKALLLGDSGAPANYTITLPNGAPVGSLIHIRVRSDATKLYTIAGSDVGLDGQPNRVLWRGESCLLFREAAQWTKLGGRTIPFRGCLQRQSAQAIAAGGWVKSQLNVEAGDAYNLGLVLDAANFRFKAPRLGSYTLHGALTHTATVATSAADADIVLSANGAGAATAIPSTFIRQSYPVGGARIVMVTSGVFSLNKDDYVELLGRITGAAVSAASFEYIVSTIAPTLSYSEIPLW